MPQVSAIAGMLLDVSKGILHPTKKKKAEILLLLQLKL